MINRLPWRKKLRTSAANNLDKINEIVDYINHSDISPVTLSESGSGRSVTAGVSSSLKSLTVHGESIQNGTPTPDNPVPVQVVEAPTSGQFGILIGDTVTPIDLQGNVLASLPDGTHDRLLVDSAGHVVIDNTVGYTRLDGTANWEAVSSGVNQQRLTNFPNAANANNTNLLCTHAVRRSNTTETGSITIYNNIVYINLGFATAEELKAYLTDNPVYIVYKLVTPQTIDLGYIDMPTIDSGDTISVSAAITPVIDVAWWCYDDITDIIRDLKAYVDYKTTDGQEQTAGLSMSRNANMSLDTQAEQPTIVKESEMI